MAPQTRVKLTAGRVANFTCSEGKQQAFLWDSEFPRLAVRATRNASKSYIYESVLNRRTVRITIGSTKTLDIAGARSEARRLQALVDKGEDPRQQAREKQEKAEAERLEQQRRRLTVAEAWQSYVTARSRGAKAWSDLHQRDHERMAKPAGIHPRTGKATKPGLLFPLMGLRLAELTDRKIAHWLETTVEEAPTAGALAFRLLRGFVRWCAERDEYAGLVDPVAVGRKTSRDRLPEPKAKADTLQREQLRDWFAAVRRIENPTITAYLQCLLLLGPRREELLGLRWTDVDFRWGSLTIRDKVEGIRVIPLPPFTSSLLGELKRLNETPPPQRLRDKSAKEWAPSPWVFSSRAAASGRLQEPRYRHNEACQAAGLPPLSLHGLRRSFANMAEWVEVPAGVVAQIQGHKPSALAEKHYRQRPVDLLRQWHAKIEKFILDEAGIEQPKQEAAPRLAAVQS